jgi:hypothetical protein
MKHESDEMMLITAAQLPVEEQVVRAAISECLPGGSTYQYFALNPWEASMRQEFAVFVQAQNEAQVVTADEGTKLLRLLNARYTTRYPVAGLPIVYESAVSVLHEYGWWNGQSPILFQATDDQVQQIVNVLVEILARIAKTPIPQPYSLLTKWLHFCLPDTFVICDSQAVKSIQASSDISHNQLGPRSPTRRQFRAISIYETGGRGYIGILNFYRLCGEAADRAGLMSELFTSSQRLEQMQHQMPNCLNTRISVLDVLDKHLWQANGNVQNLGIA